MKKILILLFAIFLLLLSTSIAAAQVTTPPISPGNGGVQLSLSQLAAISVISSALVVALRLLLEIAQKQKFIVPDFVMIIIVYVVSFAVAVWWYPQALPSPPVFTATDPVTWTPAFLVYLGQLLTALTEYAAGAGAIYLVLFQKVKNSLGPVIAPIAYKQ